MNVAPTPAEDAGRPSILIAEDHTDSREALRTLLDAMGYQVHTAGDGREAVKVALRVRPDLVLMDIMMPQMDGMAATRLLRASPEFRQVPILALTAMEGAKERAHEAGFDDHVAKPIDVQLLLDKLRSWINGEG